MSSQEIKPTNLSASLQKLGVGLKKHAGIIIVLVASVALLYSISSVNLVLSAASDSDYRTQRESEMRTTQFDQATVRKIKTLSDQQNTGDPTLPSGRINPFTE